MVRVARTCAVALVSLFAFPAAEANAGQPVSLTVWSGERGPGGESRGITLNPDGRGTA